MNRCLPEDENEDGWRWEKTKRGDVHYSCAEKKPICRIYTWHRKLESESDGKQERGMRSYLTKLHFKLTWMCSCCWLGCVFAMPQYSFKTHDHGRYSICNLRSKWLHIETFTNTVITMLLLCLLKELDVNSFQLMSGECRVSINYGSLN